MRGCSPIVFPMPATRLSSTRSTPRCGLSLPFTICWKPPPTPVEHSTEASGRFWIRRCWLSSQVTPAERVSAFGWTATVCWRPVEPGVQLTWMDAKVGDWVVTPRIGKPVEVQALWLNALWIAGRIDRRWNETFERGRAEFEKRFWNGGIDCLFDVVDVDHRPGVVDAALRPNQIFAVGGLPLALLHGERAKSVVDAVEVRLLTPLGLRTLAPGSPGYATTMRRPTERARRRLSSRNRLAVADGAVCRSLDSRARRRHGGAKHEARKQYSCRRSKPI